MKKTLSLTLFFLALSVSCKKDAEVLPKFYPYVITAEPVVTPGGVTFSADILQPGDGKIVQYGFVWSNDFGKPTISSDNKIFSADPGKGTYSYEVTGGLIKGASYAVRAYVVTDEFEVYGNARYFECQGSSPPQIAGFSPESGPIGTRVVIEGKNFAVSGSGNMVKIGGIRAVVDSVTDDRLYVKVPEVMESSDLPISLEVAEMKVLTEKPFSVWYPWKKMKDFNGGYNGITGFSVGGKAFIGLGYGHTELWEYDPATEYFVRKRDFPHGLDVEPKCFTSGNKGYAIISNGSNNYPGISTITELWEYDPDLDRWTRKADFPGLNRSAATAFSIGSKGYFAAGHYVDPYGYWYYLKDMWEYDPSTDKWTRKKDFPGSDRQLAYAFSIGTNGYMGIGATGWPQMSMYKYDAISDTWTGIGDYPGTGFIYINGFVLNNKGYLGMGGDNSGHSFADFWEFDPSGNTWKKMNSCPAEMQACVAFSLNNKGYIGFGLQYFQDDPDYRNTLYEFDPAKN